MLVGIIGTAGRSKIDLIDADLYSKMLARARDFVSPIDDLVSGGAAVADHLAVLLFLDGAARSLTLYLPERFDLGTCRFLERGPRSGGAIANYYHRQFSQRLGLPSDESLYHLRAAVQVGARLVVVPGFLQRNIPVGRVKRLVAFTFGAGDEPADGGLPTVGGTRRHQRSSGIRTSDAVPPLRYDQPL